MNKRGEEMAAVMNKRGEEMAAVMNKRGEEMAAVMNKRAAVMNKRGGCDEQEGRGDVCSANEGVGPRQRFFRKNL